MPNLQPNDRNEIYAFFKNRSDALAVVAELKDAGFTSNQIGLAMADDLDVTSPGSNRAGDSRGRIQGDRGLASQSGIDDRSAWDKIKDFFTGGQETYIGDEKDHESTYGNISSERAHYYNSGIAAGGAVLTVAAPVDRLEEAREILAEYDADVRTTGFEKTSGVASSGSSPGTSNERRIQLRGEMLRAVKQRVEKGEIRLRKDVVTENRTISVPVTREEVVVEHVSADAARPLSGSIGDEGEIRVPVSEERVSVVKEPVVTGEVRVQKRAVQDNKQVTDTVRHEEVRVENQGAVSIDDKTKTDKKKPAA